MTILVLLLALVVSHFVRQLRVFRRYGFAIAGIASIERGLRTRFPGQGWLLVLALVLALLVVCWLMMWLMSAVLGQVGLFVLALLVLAYTLGPEDLDTDVEAVLSATEEETGDRLAALGAPGDSAAGKVMRAALERWFGIIFWFVVLNILGALLYRLSCEYVKREIAHSDQAPAMVRLLALLQWPVAQLMTLALAVSADFDRVWRAWRHWHAEHGWRPFGCEMLLSASEDVAGGDDDQLAAARAMQLSWRMLMIWLVVLSLLLLAGWLM